MGFHLAFALGLLLDGCDPPARGFHSRGLMDPAHRRRVYTTDIGLMEVHSALDLVTWGQLEKIMPSANTWCVPVPLHSSQSAMALLHSNHQAYLIT